MFDYEVFDAILHMWKSPEMWGDDPVKPVSSMLYYDGINYFGGNDLSVYTDSWSNPKFLVYKQQGWMAGVISWYWIQNTVRLRGLYVKPEYRGLGIAEKLLTKALEESNRAWNCYGEAIPIPHFAWVLAGPNSTHVHEKVGFKKITEQANAFPDGNVSKHMNSYMRYDY